MDGKKIAFSFGSNKLKKPLLAPVANSFERKKVEAKKELIGSIEGVAFDVLNAPKLEEAKELVIPLPPQSSISDKIAQLVDTKRKLRKIGNLPVQSQPENETIEQRAAREIQEDLRRQDLVAAESSDNGQIVKPLNPDELPLDGGVEPTQDDYDSMPVDNFGLAMLRGMGFQGQLKKVGLDVEDAPMARPKGMGLGVDRARLAQQAAATATKEGDEKLELKKNAFAKIISGKLSGSYGVIQGMDDYSGQVYIKLTLGGAVESLQEFMLLPVSKDEYAKSSKVINSDKYEEYKSRETTKKDPQNSRHQESESSSRRQKSDKSPDDRGYRSARSSKYHNKESDSDSTDDSDDHHKRSKKKSSKSSKKSKKHSSHRRDRREDSYSYSSDDEEEKRFKKKTKKSKRPRSRSRSRSKPRR